jgi:hypothetical protein
MWLLSGVFGRLGGYAMAALALVGLYLGIKRKGRKEAEAEQERRNMENYVDTTRRAREAEQEAARRAGAMSDDELDSLLRKRGTLRERSRLRKSR